MKKQRKLPPYAKNIPTNQSCIAICTGSTAWDRAKSQGWLSGLIKTLLPIGDDIRTYRWGFVGGKDTVIFSSGKPETYERLVELSRELLRYGALKVVWCIPGVKTTSFIGKVKA